MLRRPRLAFDSLSVSFFDYWPIRMSGLLLCCTSSALNYLKTAFILTNQNWVIFSCISLAQLSIQKVIFCLFKVTRMIHVWIPWMICFFLRRLKWMKKESGDLREKSREAEGEVHTRLIGWLGRYVHKILCTRPFLRAYTVSMDNCIR